MRAFVRYIAMLLVLASLPFGLIACNRGEQGTEPSESISESSTDNTEEAKGTVIDLKENIDKLKIYGRYMLTDTGLACDMTASGIEFCGVMKGKIYIEIKSNADAYFTVYVDGRRKNRRFEVAGGREPTTIEIADLGSSEKEHTVRILKQTESKFAISEFRTLTVDGYLTEPPASRDRYIEFIGDSLTCGMGNLGDNSIVADAQTARYEDGTRGYAFITAESLGADYSIVSQSGIGIAGSWLDPIDGYYTKLSYSRDRETDYDFARVPDLVVINLGTNDYFLNKDKDPNMCTPDQIEQKTLELIELVRSSYGKDVPIVWAYGFVGVYSYDPITAAIETLGGEDAGIYLCKLTQNTGGAQWHPDKSGHTVAAEELEAFITERNLLK